MTPTPAVMKPANDVKPFTSAHSRAQWIVGLLVVCVVLDLAALGSGYAQIELLSRAMVGLPITFAEATANDQRQQIIAGWRVLVWFTTAVLFLMWLHRAHRNLPALGARQLQYTPGWAVGGFFVPNGYLLHPRPDAYRK